jgi:thiosulfate reductase cytochrome b subunit
LGSFYAAGVWENFFGVKVKMQVGYIKLRERSQSKKYRESIAGRKFGALSEIERQQLTAALTNETWRIVSRAVPWFFIIMFLITGVE